MFPSISRAMAAGKNEISGLANWRRSAAAARTAARTRKAYRLPELLLHVKKGASLLLLFLPMGLASCQSTIFQVT